MAEKLNPAQRRAVTHEGGPVLVLAGAGSGKTGVITRRIAWLIERRSVAPERIVAVTFTNKAAREMKQRVGKLLGGAAGKLTVSTFHRLGLEILRRETRAAGLNPGFSIVDPADAATIVAELLGRRFSADPAEAQTVRNAISRAKNEDREPEPDLAPVFEAYQRYLNACNAVDLDDMIALPRRLLASRGDLRERWRARVAHLPVDEYQDTNAAQYALVRLLAGSGDGLMVVGDDDQSIYAWRGAMPENLARLGDDFACLQIVKLEQNYRSRGRILKAANALIRNNRRPFEKTLWSELGPGDAIRVIPCASEVREAEQVVSELMVAQFRSRARHGDFAILYRGNHQSRLLEQKLMEMRVPYVLSGGLSFFDRTEVRDLVAYLRLIANPRDDGALLRVINTPRRGIGAGTLERIAGYAREHALSLGEALEAPGLASSLSARAAGAVGDLAALLSRFRTNVGTLPPKTQVADLLDALDYRRWLDDSSDTPETAARRWASVGDLVDWIGGIADTADAPVDLCEVVRRLMLTDMLDRRDDETDAGDRVSLMTLHAAKGLEFDHVFIVGVEEGILPHAGSATPAGVEEERRLMYVGITRARKTLTLSYCRRRRRFGETLETGPSRFLEELPREDLDWDEPGSGDDERGRTVGMAHLAGIRAMLER